MSPSVAYVCGSLPISSPSLRLNQLHFFSLLASPTKKRRQPLRWIETNTFHSLFRQTYLTTKTVKLMIYFSSLRREITYENFATVVRKRQNRERTRVTRAVSLPVHLLRKGRRASPILSIRTARAGTMERACLKEQESHGRTYTRCLALSQYFAGLPIPWPPARPFCVINPRRHFLAGRNETEKWRMQRSCAEPVKLYRARCSIFVIYALTSRMRLWITMWSCIVHAVLRCIAFRNCITLLEGNCGRIN